MFKFNVCPIYFFCPATTSYANAYPLLNYFCVIKSWGLWNSSCLNLPREKCSNVDKVFACLIYILSYSLCYSNYSFIYIYFESKCFFFYLFLPGYYSSKMDSSSVAALSSVFFSLSFSWALVYCS